MKQHKMCGTPFWKKWSGMITRCRHKESYKNKGITVCRRWQTFENFRVDMYEDYLKHVKEYGHENTTIERVNNSKGYSKTNCKFATWEEQFKNRTMFRHITFKKKTLTMLQWSKELNINYQTLAARLNKMNWSVEKALSI